jgi:hypothetical protein
MDEETIGTDAPVETESFTSVETNDLGPTDAGENPASGNPAWDDIRSSLDEFSFGKIEPHLKKFDSEAQKRIESLNSQVKEVSWARELSEQGVDPERVQMALAMAERLDSDPKEFYNLIGQHLQEQGLLTPEMAEALDEAGGDSEEDAYVPPHLKAQLEQMQQQQEQMQQYFQEQQYEQMVQEADAEIASEIDELKSANPNLDDFDVKQVLNVALQITQRNAQQGVQRVATLAEAAAEYQQLQQHILSKQNGTAPRTLPVSGGGAPSQAPVDPAKMSKKEFMQMIAQDVQSLQAQ